MADIDCKVWTIRGLVDVSDDIFMLPGDQFRFVRNPDKTFRIIVLAGNPIWERCVNLRLEDGEVPTMKSPAPSSKTMTDNGSFAKHVRAFVGNPPPQLPRRYVGTLLVSVGDEADVTVYCVKTMFKDVLIINAVPNSSGGAENGTGHGD